MSEPLPTIAELLSETSNAVDSAFERVEWVESRIKYYSEQYPERAPWLFDSYKYGYDGVPLPLWEHPHGWSLHVETLIRRVAKKQDVLKVTKADMLFIISHYISKAIPLHGSPRHLYYWLFQQVFPDHAKELNISVKEELPHEVKPYYMEMAKLIIATRPKPNPQRYYNIFAEEAIEPEPKATPLRQLSFLEGD
jgi:hypothetical protein